MTAIGALLFWLLYFSPSIAAVWRRMTDPELAGKPLGNVFFINAFLGWTVLGWFVAWFMVITKRFGEAVQMSAYSQSTGAAWNTPKQANSTCFHCGGSGRMTCTSCGGAGSEYAQPAVGMAQPAGCSTCSRTGRITCYYCHGTGRS